MDSTRLKSGFSFKSSFYRGVRKAVFLITFFVFGWLIWLLLAATKKLKLFNYLFLVYPGTDRDLEGYCPKWLGRSFIFSKRPVPVGFISKGAGVRGLVLAVPNTTKELVADKKVSEKITQRMMNIKGRVGAQSIALAGQLPGIIYRHGSPIEVPFVDGRHGTVFSVMETVSEIAAKHNLVPGKFKIVLVGVGYTGSLLMGALDEQGHDILGIDIVKKEHGGVVLSENGPSLLQTADVVIVLTPRGSDFEPYVKFLKKGAIVIDDTHPKIHEKPQNVTFYKVAIGMKNVKFYPRLPGYRADWIPGCAVEAIVAAATGKFGSRSQAEFNQQAKELGFFAHLVS